MACWVHSVLPKPQNLSECPSPDFSHTALACFFECIFRHFVSRQNLQRSWDIQPLWAPAFHSTRKETAPFGGCTPPFIWQWLQNIWALNFGVCQISPPPKKNKNKKRVVAPKKTHGCSLVPLSANQPKTRHLQKQIWLGHPASRFSRSFASQTACIAGRAPWVRPVCNIANTVGSKQVAQQVTLNVDPIINQPVCQIRGAVLGPSKGGLIPQNSPREE